jgi:glycerate kinase
VTGEGSLLTPADLVSTGIRGAYALTDVEPGPDRCMREAGPLLELLAERVADDWLGSDYRA